MTVRVAPMSRGKAWDSEPGLAGSHHRFQPDTHIDRNTLTTKDDPPVGITPARSVTSWKVELGRRIDPALLPGRLYSGSGTEDIGGIDYFGPAHAGCSTVVTGKMRAIIERFEPDVHQFIPVDVFSYEGEPVACDYFYFINLQLAYTVDLNSPAFAKQSRPQFNYFNLPDPPLEYPPPSEVLDGLMLPVTLHHNKERVGTMKWWREVRLWDVDGLGEKGPRFSDIQHMVDDKLYRALIDEGCRGIFATVRGDLV